VETEQEGMQLGLPSKSQFSNIGVSRSRVSSSGEGGGWLMDHPQALPCVEGLGVSRACKSSKRQQRSAEPTVALCTSLLEPAQPCAIAAATACPVTQIDCPVFEPNLAVREQGRAAEARGVGRHHLCVSESVWLAPQVALQIAAR